MYHLKKNFTERKKCVLNRFAKLSINVLILKIIDIMIYLTAIGLTPDGSSTHLHTNNTKYKTIDTTQYIEIE